MRTAVIHVGLEKTGTTLIQRWLASNHRQLLQEGFWMPKCLGFPNHTRLVAACLDDGVVDNIKAHLLRREGIDEALLRWRVAHDLHAESRKAGDWHTLVISSELISSRLASSSEQQRLVSLVHNLVDRIRILLVVRRQDQLAISRFSSVLRSGFNRYDAILEDLSSFNFWALPPGRTVSDHHFFYDLEGIARRFASLADDGFSIRVHGEQHPIDMIQDVMECSIPWSVNTNPPLNQAMSARAQFVIARLNQSHLVQWPSGARRDGYRQLLQQVEARVPGVPRQISPERACRFLQAYQPGNQRLCDHYGLSRSLCADPSADHRNETDDQSLMEDTKGLVTHYLQQADELPARESLLQRANQRRRGLGHRLVRALSSR
jgi:hypothetical protein